jgi:amidase
LERTPGGSTGGGAASLAAGISFFSLGSDVGGSIRIPAHFCGTYGHRPSVNVVSLKGHIPSPPYSPQIFWAAGPLARNAEDLKLGLEILGGPTPEESKAYGWTLPPERENYLSDYRLGYVIDHEACPLAKDVKDVMLNAVNKLRKEGLDIEEGWPEGVDPIEEYNTYRFLMASIYAGFLKDEEYEEMQKASMTRDGSYESTLAWAWTAPHKHFQEALKKRMKARVVWQNYFKTHDAFILPVSFISAFAHDHSQPYWNRRLSTLQGQRKYEELFFWVSFATLTGLPSTVAPIGLSSEGLPVGMQIIGPYLEDATPIDIASKIVKLFGGFKLPRDFIN